VICAWHGRFGGAPYVQYALTQLLVTPPSLANAFPQKPVWLPPPRLLPPVARAEPAPGATLSPLSLTPLVSAAAAFSWPPVHQAAAQQCAPTHTERPRAPLLVAALVCGAGPEPASLDAWAGVLRATPSTLLWLVGVPEAALEALRAEMTARGIAPTRLLTSPFTTLHVVATSDPQEEDDSSLQEEPLDVARVARTRGGMRPLRDPGKPLSVFLRHAALALSPSLVRAPAAPRDTVAGCNVQAAMAAGVPTLVAPGARPSSRAVVAAMAAMPRELAQLLVVPSFRALEATVR
jgi:hypothetical protein